MRVYCLVMFAIYSKKCSWIPYCWLSHRKSQADKQNATLLTYCRRWFSSMKFRKILLYLWNFVYKKCKILLKGTTKILKLFCFWNIVNYNAAELGTHTYVFDMGHVTASFVLRTQHMSPRLFLSFLTSCPRFVPWV